MLLVSQALRLCSAGEPSEKVKYVFDGDFVDRGHCGMEVCDTYCHARLTRAAGAVPVAGISSMSA